MAAGDPCRTHGLPTDYVVQHYMTQQQPALIHEWAVTPAEARRIQTRLAAKVSLADAYPALRRVAGVDVGFEDGGAVTRAALVLLSWPTLEPLEQVLVRHPTRFPYVPGLLSFRELPAVLDAFEQLSAVPDLVFCDGQGVAHPRRLGIAAHLGVLTGLACIGVGKSRLIGRHDAVGDRRGDCTPLWLDGARIGSVLRSRTGVRPLYVSPGHRVAQETAPQLVMQALTRFRLPEPIRAAHRLASAPAIARAAERSASRSPRS
ncbi:endonuclease V [Acidihalobacter prosperus]|uniref:Endonuclease V n=2 Tax=Acidihalobacter prosperus TaxID=160660 RepID=A0A1A6C176_9GAMM|nr:endonuclease V [Acidihalobacter prosperus]